MTDGLDEYIGSVFVNNMDLRWSHLAYLSDPRENKLSNATFLLIKAPWIIETK